MDGIPKSTGWQARSRASSPACPYFAHDKRRGIRRPHGRVRFGKIDADAPPRLPRPVMALLRELAETGHTVILITHDPKVAGEANRIVKIRDGQIVAPETVETRKAGSIAADAARHCEARSDAAIHVAVQPSKTPEQAAKPPGLPRERFPLLTRGGRTIVSSWKIMNIHGTLR